MDGKCMTWNVSCRPETVGDVRGEIRKMLADWGVADADDNVLIASELVTNAIRHGAPDITLTLTVIAGQVLGAVTDHSPVLPRMRAVDELAVCGRGLLLVAELSADWGVTTRSDIPGKSIWWRWESCPDQTH
jgi:anti-sigma regulatory factor (Ser/Thr protein kinase)